MLSYIDTHCHLDGEEFAADREAVVQRAREAGCMQIFLPAIDLASCHTVIGVCQHYPDFCRPMLGLHPEEVRADWRDQLAAISNLLLAVSQEPRAKNQKPIAIGEIGLDFYWSREFEQQQLVAFERQVRWACRTRLPLMIHCRKAQNEMVAILRKYKDELPGGVFHCFTGNLQEARQLLDFSNFVLGIGGVLTFKKSHLPEVLAQLPTDRIVLETDAPYMAPVPMRGKRNESALLVHVIQKMAECWGISAEQVADITTHNALRIFHIQD